MYTCLTAIMGTKQEAWAGLLGPVSGTISFLYKATFNNRSEASHNEGKIQSSLLSFYVAYYMLHVV